MSSYFSLIHLMKYISGTVIFLCFAILYFVKYLKAIIGKVVFRNEMIRNVVGSHNRCPQGIIYNK